MPAVLKDDEAGAVVQPVGKDGARPLVTHRSRTPTIVWVDLDVRDQEQRLAFPC